MNEANIVKDAGIDRSAIARLLDVIGGGHEDLKELVEEFHVSAPALVSRMEAAVQSGDLDALRISSHSLKANARDFGAVALADLCERLEHACKTGTVDDGGGQVSAVARELSAARTALEGIIAID
jgi:HPt (histidine-containing phosphotransfer) domain-containing protein